MDLLKQLRVVFVGIPDSGKSTLISHIIKFLFNKTVSPDTLMNELEYSNGTDIYGKNDTRTIKAAKIIIPYGNYEIMLIDAPGHVEYMDEIISAINMSSIVIGLIDVNRKKGSLDYLDKIIFPQLRDQKFISINTHTTFNDENNFASNLDGNESAVCNIIKQIDESKNTFVDIEQEARDIIKETIPQYNNPVIMFSGGKDSVVGNDLLKNYVTSVIFPNSGFDFKELLAFVDKEYPDVKRLKNIPEDVTYDNSTVFEIHKHKADFNNKIENINDLLCINYCASDEGVRSKDHYIKFGITSYRFSPVFYFSEENIWRYIAKYNLSYCPLYNKGYRSLGDYPVTMPCMPCFDRIEDIIVYIHNHPFEERDGRTQQDKSEKYAMEKLRNIGFF